MRLIGVILAGGQGRRLWPKSTPSLPKPFVSVGGGQTLLQEAVGRLRRLTGWEDIVVVAASAQARLVRGQLPDLPEANLVLEPAARGTGPAVALAALTLAERVAALRDTAVVICPSDHAVTGQERWEEAIRTACRVAEAGSPALVGVPPTRPETAYGYILTRPAPTKVAAESAVEVAPGAVPEMVPEMVPEVMAFVEKPGRERAEELLAAGGCLWHAGIHAWRLDALAASVDRHMPGVSSALKRVLGRFAAEGRAVWGATDWPAVAAVDYAALPAISFDVAVLEKLNAAVPERVGGARAVAGTFGWEDAGTWEALARLGRQDHDGNVPLTPASFHDARDCVVDWPGGQAVIAGVSGLVVACHNGRLLVCARDRLDELERWIEASP